MAKEVTFTHDEIRGILMAQGLLLPEETLTIGPKSAPTTDSRPTLFPAHKLRPGEVGFDSEDAQWVVKDSRGGLQWFSEEGKGFITEDVWGHVQVCEGRNPPEQVAAFAAQEAKRA